MSSNSTGYIARAAWALPVALFMLFFARGFSFAGFWRTINGLPNLGIEELPELLSEEAQFTMERLDRRSKGDDRHVRLFNPWMEITYTAQWEHGRGLVEIVHARCEDKRGIQLMFVQRALVEFQRLNSSPMASPQLWPYDRAALEKFMVRIRELSDLPRRH